MPTLLLQLADDGIVTTLGRIADGDAGVDQTAAAIRGVVKEFAHDMEVDRTARTLSGPQTLYHFLRTRVYFAPDPAGVELIRTPAMLLRQIARGGKARGDCDDMATLGASLLAAMGKRPVLAVVSPTAREQGGRFVHIFFGYEDAAAKGGYVLMDPQEGFTPAAVPSFARARIYTADGEHAP